MKIGDENITTFEDLKNLFSRKEIGDLSSSISMDLINNTVDGILAEFINDLGRPELADKVRRIDVDGSDPDIMRSLVGIISGAKVQYDTKTYYKVLETSSSKEGCPYIRFVVLKPICATIKLEIERNGKKIETKTINLQEYRINEEVVISFKKLQNSLSNYDFLIDGNSIKNISEDKGKAISDLMNGLLLYNTPSKTLHFFCDNISFDMIEVKGGVEFIMGDYNNEGLNFYKSELWKEHKLHYQKEPNTVKLSDYYIGKYEVTQELWKTVMGSNPSYCYNNPQNPVEHVNWWDCMRFLWEFNKKLESQLNGMAFVLPTEAQWEYAARGGNKSKGYKYSGSNKPEEVGWWGKKGGSTHQVGLLKGNELGLYDMSGNVFEWCFDIYEKDYENNQIDPIGITNGDSHVLRGGSADYPAADCKVTSSIERYPAFNGNANTPPHCYVGLRLALVPKESEQYKVFLNHEANFIYSFINGTNAFLKGITQRLSIINNKN